MLTYNNFLNEGKIEDLSIKYKGKLEDFEITYLKSLSDNSSVNLKWLLKHFKNDKVNYENNIAGLNILLDVLDAYFKVFLRIKKNLPLKYRDINNIDSTNKLIELVDKYNHYDKIKDDKEVDLLEFNYKWIVFIPKTFKAAEKWGWGRFCTSNDEMYHDFYNILNKSLIYIMHKFDYTKNIVVEVYPDYLYQIWNYQDDNSFGGVDTLERYLEDNDEDGFLDVLELIEELPIINDREAKQHYTNFMLKEFDLKTINKILNSELEEKDASKIEPIVRNMEFDKLKSDIKDWF